MRTNTTLQVHYYALYVVLLALLALAHFKFACNPIWVLPNTASMMVSTINVLFLLAIPLMFKLFAVRVRPTSIEVGLTLTANNLNINGIANKNKTLMVLTIMDAVLGNTHIGLQANLKWANANKPNSTTYKA